MADEKEGTTSTPEPTKSAWETRVGVFAEAVSKDLDNVTSLLKPLVGEPSEAALAVLDNTEAVTDDDLIAALSNLKIPKGVLKMHLKKLRGLPVVSEDVVTTASAGAPVLSYLPQVPDADKFLEKLKTDGILKVNDTDVLAAMKAALADRIGLFEIPSILLKKMEAFAEGQEEPVGKDFWRVQKLLTQKKYGEILSALDVPGNFMTEGRKDDLLRKLGGKLWPALTTFQDQLNGWYDAWLKGMNPAAAMMAIAAQGTGATMPPTLMNPPDTSPLRDAGEEVINEINRVFSGTGIPAARAIAHDATRIMNVLNEPALPAQVGATSKEQMLKDLRINVGADLIRTEKSATQYALAIMYLPQVPMDKKTELGYFSELFQLGAMIPWEKLAGVKAGIGRKPL